MDSISKFVTLPLLSFRTEEHVYRERVEQERTYGLDAALFAVHGIVLISTLTNIPSGTISETFSILSNIFLLFLALSTIFYVLPRSNATIQKIQRTLRIPIHVAIEIINASIFVYLDNLTSSAVASPLSPEYFALEGFVAHLIWPMSYPIIAAIPLAVAMPVQILVGSIYISNNRSMCKNALKAHPQTIQLYTMLQTFLTRMATSLRFSANNPFSNGNSNPATATAAPTMFWKKAIVNSQVSIESEAMCSNILLVLEISMLILVFFYLLFVSEISERQVYSAISGERELYGELKRRRPYVWQVVGEMALAWIVLWNVATLLTDEWKLKL